IQMAVHVPLSAEAQAEARALMLTIYKLLNAKEEKPVATPTQDMVLGCYYLTLEKEGALGEGRVFADTDEARMALDHGHIDLHARIKVRMPGADGKPEMVETTVGRLIFHESLPEGLAFHNDVVDRHVLARIVAECFRRWGYLTTAKTLDALKELGFHYATRAGTTISVKDVIIPDNKEEIITKAQKAVEQVEAQYQRGLLTPEERYQKVIDIWTETRDEITENLKEQLDIFNPIRMMAISGARGNWVQISQLGGMRGLMADPSGRTIELPVRSNFREGLTVLEYFISTHGARKGLADTALRTAD